MVGPSVGSDSGKNEMGKSESTWLVIETGLKPMVSMAVGSQTQARTKWVCKSMACD